MAKYKYSFQNYNAEKMARVVGVSMPISTKQSIEVSSYLRGRTLNSAKKILNDAINLKKPIPFMRFTDSVGHKKGLNVQGRFACKTSENFLKLLESCEANAKNKGLDTENLIIVHINAHKAAQQWHYGRIRRIRFKKTHVEIVLEEKSSEKRRDLKLLDEKKQKDVQSEKKELKTEEKKELKEKLKSDDVIKTEEKKELKEKLKSDDVIKTEEKKELKEKSKSDDVIKTEEKKELKEKSKSDDVIKTEEKNSNVNNKNDEKSKKVTGENKK
jgi:large subunit ribosomal protein L22